MSKIHPTEFDELAIVDVEDIHVLLTSGRGHVGNNARILNAHLRTLQSVAPSHGLSLHTLKGIQPAKLFHRLLVEPIGYLLNGAVLIVDDLCSRNAATLVVYERVEVHQVVALSEDV